MKPYLFRPAAAGDVQRVYLWYERQHAGVGEEFLNELRAAMDAVLTAPEMYPILHRQMRRVLVHRFPYGLFYRLVGDTVVFIACMHMHRDPASWKRRR